MTKSKHMSTFYSRKAIQPQTPDIHIWKNVAQFVFNSLNYTNIQFRFACGVKQMAFVILGAKFLPETEEKTTATKLRKHRLLLLLLP